MSRPKFEDEESYHLLDQNSAQTETKSELHDLYLLYFFKLRILQGKQEINLYIWHVLFSKIKRDYMVTKLYFSLINMFYRRGSYNFAEMPEILTSGRLWLSFSVHEISLKTILFRFETKSCL